MTSSERKPSPYFIEIDVPEATVFRPPDKGHSLRRGDFEAVFFDDETATFAHFADVVEVLAEKAGFP